MSLWGKHQAGQCDVVCRYCTAALTPTRPPFLIAPKKYAIYRDECKRQGVKTLVK